MKAAIDGPMAFRRRGQLYRQVFRPSSIPALPDPATQHAFAPALEDCAMLGECVAVLAVRRLFNVPTLTDHITLIIRVRSQPQVCWIAAGRVVAGVADVHPFRNIPLEQVECEPVDHPSLPIHIGPAVAKFVPRTLPYPASIFGEFTPRLDFRQSLFRRENLLSSHHSSRRELCALGTGLVTTKSPSSM